MSKMYYLVERARYDEEALLELIKLFEPKIYKSLYFTTPSHREDLLQELNYKLINCIWKYDLNSVPGFWEFKDHVMSR
ncbi:helix-turn-helix domain-containing protein [Bacillus ndiopicus]|uniref:helix-turn-helix domain-containing protein n=1 Tax=Bacillus ndiopicus TaxID=1347368 RepID=UPI0005AA43DD|nr:helix-turn-helix domain-containing protein [Bacillus ndiopicus]